MKPLKNLADIPNDIILEDIQELTTEFPIEFPELFHKIKVFLNIDPQYIYMTDFFGDENNDENFYGYFFDSLNRKIYQYAFEGENTVFTEKDINALTLRDTVSLKVLGLL